MRVVFIPTGGLIHSFALIGNTISFLGGAHKFEVWSRGSASFANQPFSSVFTPLYPIVKENEDELSIGADLEYRITNRGKGLSRKYELLESGQLKLGSMHLEEAEKNGKEAFFFTSGTSQVQTFTKNELLIQAVQCLRLESTYSLRVTNSLPFAGTPYIGVHFRNSDSKGNLDKSISLTKKMMSDHGIHQVYWATDDLSSANEAQIRLGKVDFAHSRVEPLGMLENLHFGLPAHARQEHLFETLTDLHVLMHSAIFVPATAPTGWSGFLTTLRDNPKLAATFFGGDRDENFC